MMNSPAICFVVLVENRARRGSFAGHPVIVSLVNELLVSALRPPALFDFPHIIRKSGEINKSNHKACHFQCIESLSPWQGQNLPLLVLLISPAVLFVPQTGRSCGHLRMNRRAVSEVLCFIFCLLFKRHCHLYVRSEQSTSMKSWHSKANAFQSMSLLQMQVAVPLEWVLRTFFLTARSQTRTHLQIILMSSEVQSLVLWHSWLIICSLAN